MYIEFIFLVLHLSYAQSRFLPESNVSETNHSKNIVEETQHAACKITSADLEATANATITRQLKGVCTTTYLDEKINLLEQNLLLEFDKLKTALQHLSYSELELEKKPTQNLFKSAPLSPKSNILNNFSDRRHEILQHNMTIQKYETGIKFLYFWEIENIGKLFQSSTVLESEDFYFSGNHLYVRIFTNYEKSEDIFIQVVGLEEFTLPHTFTILDQTNSNFDLVSPQLHCKKKMYTFQTECTEFKFSQKALLKNNFIMNNNLIVKLLIYLEY